MIVDDGASRRSARNRGLYRVLAAFCAAGAMAAVMLAMRAPSAPGGARIDADTRFDFVAVFAPGMDAAAVERWRADVLRVHRSPCLAHLPCVARVVRFAGLGTQSRYAIAFDLNREIDSGERAALLAAANAAPARVRLVAAATPRVAAGD